MRLCDATLNALPGEIARPGYRTHAHGVGVVHLGVGAFHRAHQAAYLDTAMARSGGDWRILAVALRSSAVPDRLREQDGLYTLVEQDGNGTRRRIVGSIADGIAAQREPARVRAALAAPATRLVTLTVTEKGYCHVPASGELDQDHPDVVHDLIHPDRPRSVPGQLAAGLGRRRADRAGPITLLSCDNLPDNGAILRRVLLAFADRLDPALARWIEAEVAFPSSMVDRIVPAPTAQDVDALEQSCGYRDEATVRTEYFTQWVVEDRFAAGRPDLAAAGVQLVDDVSPFEAMKLRMLNAAHSLLAYLGLLAGDTFVHEALARPEQRTAVRALMLDEAAPTLRLDGVMDFSAYADALMARFANPTLAHRLDQIASDGSFKLAVRLVPTLAANLDRAGPTDMAARAIAAWALVGRQRYRHVRFPGVSDQRDVLLAKVLATSDDATTLAAALLSFHETFGSLADRPAARATIAAQIDSLAAW